jgi:hypothetical protein
VPDLSSLPLRDKHAMTFLYSRINLRDDLKASTVITPE